MQQVQGYLAHEEVPPSRTTTGPLKNTCGKVLEITCLLEGPHEECRSAWMMLQNK